METRVVLGTAKTCSKQMLSTVTGRGAHCELEHLSYRARCSLWAGTLVKTVQCCTKLLKVWQTHHQQ